MNRRPVTPAVRRRRIFTDALLLLAGVALLLLMLDVPIPYFTQRQALSATQTRYLYGPGAVLARVENDTSVDCILQDGSCYAVCTLPREGLFWGQGTLDAVVNDPSLPLVPLPRRGSLLVVANDPNIAEVEVLYPVQRRLPHPPADGAPGGQMLSVLPPCRAEQLPLRRRRLPPPGLRPGGKPDL